VNTVTKLPPSCFGQCIPKTCLDGHGLSHFAYGSCDTPSMCLSSNIDVGTVCP
jgi:hypothetical protein